MDHSLNPSQWDELESLLIDADDDSIDESGLQRLRQILKSSPSARERFVQLRLLTAAMHLEGNSTIDLGSDLGLHEVRGLGEVQPIAIHNRSSQPDWRKLLMIAASFLMFALIGRWWILESRLNRSAEVQAAENPLIVDSEDLVEATSQGVAVVSRLVDAHWKSDDDVLQVGDSLSPGKVSIDSGLAQVEFYCGATIVLEGPAQLEMQSPTRVRFLNGRLRANVPPAARGFEVLVDEMKVVDLGTEFGISLSPENADVHVFDGEIELHRPKHQMQLLTAGESVSRSAGGERDLSSLPAEDYVDIQELDEQAESQTNLRWQKWKSYSSRVSSDPRLIVYYALEDDQSWNRRLSSSIVPRNPDLDGAIVGATRATGRWPEKSAIEFKRPGDRVRVNIPDEFRSLTFACWVKIDSLDRWFNSLFLTDNYQRGEPHWQILNTGQLFFSVRVRDGDIGQEHQEVLSPPFWEPSMSGQWMHLATTYDVDKKRTSHFLNGNMISRETINDSQLVYPTRIGKASIGNWSLPTKPDSKFAIRNLNGSIDEFTMFSEALTAEEIRDIYENGKP